jgi:hypothetical protein
MGNTPLALNELNFKAEIGHVRIKNIPLLFLSLTVRLIFMVDKSVTKRSEFLLILW